MQQLCATESTVDILEKRSGLRGFDWQLVIDSQKGKNVEAASERNTFAELEDANAIE